MLNRQVWVVCQKSNATYETVWWIKFENLTIVKNFHNSQTLRQPQGCMLSLETQVTSVCIWFYLIQIILSNPYMPIFWSTNMPFTRNQSTKNSMFAIMPQTCTLWVIVRLGTSVSRLNWFVYFSDVRRSCRKTSKIRPTSPTSSHDDSDTSVWSVSLDSDMYTICHIHLTL